MRRRKQLLPEAEAAAILGTCTSGVLAVHGDDGYPYAVPLSFAFEDGRLYFHAAVAGHKLDALGTSDKASFCVIAQDDIVPERFTTHYRSVIAFGRLRVVTDEERKRHALLLLAGKYSPDHLHAAEAEIDGDWKRVLVLELVVEHLTGKASIELARERARKL
jgi:nitroimidazol reductase NimA-like FMN-containing flavoprotein (pyridoxamine 5'-phosphate oxidase superfamily)